MNTHTQLRVERKHPNGLVSFSSRNDFSTVVHVRHFLCRLRAVRADEPDRALPGGAQVEEAQGAAAAAEGGAAGGRGGVLPRGRGGGALPGRRRAVRRVRGRTVTPS